MHGITDNADFCVLSYTFLCKDCMRWKRRGNYSACPTGMKVRGTTRKSRQTGSRKDGKNLPDRARQKLLLLRKSLSWLEWHLLRHGNQDKNWGCSFFLEFCSSEEPGKFYPVSFPGSVHNSVLGMLQYYLVWVTDWWSASQWEKQSLRFQAVQ